MTTLAEPHVYYDLLPSYIARNAVLAEHDELLVQVQETLACLEALRADNSSNSAAGSSDTQLPPLAKRHFRVVTTLFALKHELPKTLHLQLLHVLADLLWTRNGRDFDDIHMELRALSTFEWLLVKWAKRSASDQSDLTLSWRAAWQGIERACFKTTGSLRVAAQASLQQLCTRMVKSVEKGRKYFSATDASMPLLLELWAEFAPTIRATDSNECFKALALLTLFAVVPCAQSAPSDYARVEQLLPEWFATWPLVSKCAEWDGQWLKLLSRVAKTHPGATVWTPFLPFLFAQIHDSLELPSDLGAPYKTNTWPSAFYVIAGTKRTENYAMRLCVDLLRNPPSSIEASDSSGNSNSNASPAPSANTYVLEILNLLKAFFHPSNVANSANALGVAVYFFSNMLARRLGTAKVLASSDSTESLTLATCAPLLDALLELAFFGIYSKNRSVASKCMYLIKNVVCIDPARTAAPVLIEMMKALDPMAMSHAHLASTAISTMGVVLYHLMCGKDPRGTGLFFSTYLAPMLQRTLPGIDANDEKKTGSTIALYFHVLSWLPLVNDTSKSGHINTTKQRNALSTALFDEMAPDFFGSIATLSDDTNQKLWELGAFLEEWALALLDRCLEFIKSRVGQTEGASQARSASSSDRNSHNARHHEDDPIVMDVLNMMGLLYLQLSPEIYAQSVRKTLRFVGDVFFTTRFGGKVVSQLVHVCVQADPSHAFAPFMALVLDKLRASADGINVASLALNEKMWLLHLFDGVVRSNSAGSDRPVLAFQAQVRAVLAHFLTHEDDAKELYETAHTVLEHLLESLVNVYPSEFRSLPPTEWADAVSADSGMFQYLGTAVTWRRVAIAWHEPSADELAFAYELLDAHVLRSLTSLATAQTALDRSVRTWVPRLQLVHHAVNGAKNVLVNRSAASSSLLANGSRQLLEHTLGASNAALLQQLVDLKATLMDATHAFVQFWHAHGTGSTNEIQIWQALIALIHELLVARGDPLETHQHRIKHNKFSKATTMDVASDAVRRARQMRDRVPTRDQVPLASRNEMIERVLHFYAKRKVQEHYELARSTVRRDDKNGSTDDASHRTRHEALLLDLETLMKNAYGDISSDATTAMRDLSELYTTWYYSRIESQLQVLEGVSGDSDNNDKDVPIAEETIAGAVQFLSRSIAMKYLWKHRNEFYARVVHAVLHVNDTLLRRVLGEAKKRKAGVRVELFFKSLLASWRYVRHADSSSALLESLLVMEPQASEHWKFQLVHLASLYPLLQPLEQSLPLGVYDLVIRQLRNDVLPVRHVAFVLFAHLVQLRKHAPRNDSDSVKHIDALLFAPATMQTVVDMIVMNLKSMHSAGASAEASSAPANWSFGVDDILNAFAVHSSSYPRPPPLSTVRLLNQSRSTFVIGVNTTKLIQKLVQIDAAAVAASGVIAYLRTLAVAKTDAKINDEERQAVLTTLAEWITGLLRGLLKTTTLTEAEAQIHIASVLDVLETTLPHVSVANATAWSQVLYLVARPARRSTLPLERLAPLVTFLLDALEQSFVRATAEDYARQVKWLVLVEALAVHVFAAATACASSSSNTALPLAQLLSLRVLAVIDAFALTHQYKIIRDRVGRMLFLLGVYAWASPLCGTQQPAQASIVDATALPVAKLVAAAALERDSVDSKEDGDSIAMDDNDDTHDNKHDATRAANDDATTSLYARETAMQWLACIETHGDTHDVVAVMQALFPVAFLSQNHPKAEVAVLAKNTTNALATSLRLFYVPPTVDDAASTTGGVSPDDLQQLLALLERLATHRFWKTRGAVLRFVTTFAFYHWVFFSDAQRARVQSLVCAMLTDNQREVQEMAKYTLRSLMHHQPLGVVTALSQDWSNEARDMRILTPKTKRRITRLETEAEAAGVSTSDELVAARAKLATSEAAMVRSVLGLCAVVLAFPHTVPAFVPPLFEELGRFLYLKHNNRSSGAVSYLEKAVKETLLEFKRTHQDNWLETKRTFSAAQLDVIEDVSISPGYYT